MYTQPFVRVSKLHSTSEQGTVSNTLKFTISAYWYWNSDKSLDLDLLGIPVFRYWKSPNSELTVFGLKLWEHAYRGLKVFGIRVTGY